MGKSSLASEMRFDSFKVDHLVLNMAKNLAMLRFKGVLVPEGWTHNVNFLIPSYFTQSKVYAAGVIFKMFFHVPGSLPPEQLNASNSLVSVECNISGVFSCESGRLSKDVEDSLVKVTAPAILMPHLRSTVLSLLATGGFGYAEIPLFNVHGLATTALKDAQIADVDA